MQAKNSIFLRRWNSKSQEQVKTTSFMIQIMLQEKANNKI
jgi:hypothetical protein